MLRSEIRVLIPGTPAPKGSLKCVGSRGRGHQLVEDNANTTPWRVHVATVARRHLEAAGHVAPKGTPVGVELTFTLPRPASHYGTGRNAHKLKPSAPTHPTGHGTGDVDKYVRLILDALQDATVVVDDSQVVELTARKAYVDPDPVDDVLGHPGVVIRLYPIGDP